MEIQLKDFLKIGGREETIFFVHLIVRLEDCYIVVMISPSQSFPVLSMKVQELTIKENDVIELFKSKYIDTQLNTEYQESEKKLKLGKYNCISTDNCLIVLQQDDCKITITRSEMMGELYWGPEFKRYLEEISERYIID